MAAPWCAFATATGMVLSSCGGGGGGGGVPSASVGTLATNPATGLQFVVTAHAGGDAPSLRLIDVAWGRLVDLYDFDAASGASRAICRDFVIGADVVSDGATVRLEHNPFTERESLTILAPQGTALFDATLATLDRSAHAVLDKSLDPSELPPFSAVPRNAVLVLAFDDLLDDGGDPGDASYPGTVSGATVRVASGYPPVLPFEARVFPDPSHGDVRDGRFHSTRVIVDPSVSALESLASGLPLNTLGLPAAISTAQPNVVVRVPTRIAPQTQQFAVLTSLGGRPLDFSGNGPTDPLAPSLDVVRALRSGGKTSITGDLDNGFLADHVAPQILVAQRVSVSSVAPLAGIDEFVLDCVFYVETCAFAPRRGDGIELGSNVAEVVDDYTGSLAGGVVSGLRVRVVQGDVATFAPGQGELKTRWSAALGVPPECALRFLAEANDPPAAGVPLDARIVLSFSEALDPESATALDTLSITYDAPIAASPLYERVVGRVTPSADLRQFTFHPTLPLRHVAGEATSYSVHVGALTDLAGNPGVSALPPAHFTLDPAAPALDSGSVSLGFASGDEDGDGAPELRGQVFHEFLRGTIRPRAVTHFSAVADPSVTMVNAMASPAPPRPIQTPLSNHGSRLQALWRYCDFGFGLLDDATHDLDLEGFHWQPFSGQLSLDHFAEFEMLAAHSSRAPDEATTLGLPAFPDSGLSALFAENLLDPSTDAPVVIHPLARGYTVQPSETFVTSTGTVMAPWPFNRGLPQSEYVYWTWRDTSKLAVGGPNVSGVDPQRLQQVTKVAHTGFYGTNQVPTIGLPLLLDFRTRPDASATGQNGFRIAIALGSSANPFFRAFTTGYATCSGQVFDIDPTTQTMAGGGYDPVACATTPGQDDAFYYSQADFVVRVSRAHTAWFDTLGASLFAEPVVEPGTDSFPSGTQLVLAFRGATAIAPAGSVGWRDATNYSPYGESYDAAQLAVFAKPATLAFTPQFVGNASDKSWKPTLGAIGGARYVQVRLSFLSNPITGLSPELSALGLAFRR